MHTCIYTYIYIHIHIHLYTIIVCIESYKARVLTDIAATLRGYGARSHIILYSIILYCINTCIILYDILALTYYCIVHVL